MVDCHWRFTEAGAFALLRDLADVGLFWLECSVSETPENHPALARLRAFAGELGVRLTGAERQPGLWSYAPIIQAKAFDVIMPDIRYLGGYAEFLHVARLTAIGGVEVVPHNPGAPVSAIASAHVCTSIPNFLIIEHMLAENPLYHEMLTGEIGRASCRERV